MGVQSLKKLLAIRVELKCCNKCLICVVLTSDQWKLVTTSDPLKAIVVPNAKHEGYN